MKAVILVGGLGTRLQPYTTFLPKPMLPLGEKPLLEHLIEWVGSNGIREIVLCVSYLRKAIEDYFEDGERFDMDIRYAVSSRPLATAGQLKTAAGLLDDTFVCIYGDSIFDFDLKEMVERHRSTKSFITIGLYRYKTKLPYGVIETDGDGRVSGWKEKPEIETDINMGCYVMEPGVMKYIPEDRPYGMDMVVRSALSDRRKVTSFLTKDGFADIGDKKSYEETNRRFLDRLGSI